MKDTFYVTTPIYYINDVPHIGHAYTTVAADVLARWRRAHGQKVMFLTGTDEHGQKVARAAEAAGVDPQTWADRTVERWKETWAQLDIAYDDFIRTTEQRHVTAVQHLWDRLHQQGDVYLDTYEGLYCVSCEQFYSPDELVDGKCPIHGRPVELVREENYFFRLSKYADRLLELYRERPDFVRPPARLREVVSFVEQGLQDLSISRSTFGWGVPIPWDPKQVMYVWVDALQNYITAAGWDADLERFERIWPVDYHFVGKDILRFHAVIWPAILMAAGLELPMTVQAHGWLLVGGEWEGMVERYNADLANGLGNLASRVTAMVERYRDGVLPAPASEGEPEASVREAAERAYEEASEALRGDLAFERALAAIWRFVGAANGYISERKPWDLAKAGDDDALDTVLYTGAEALRVAALLVAPWLTKAAPKLWAALGVPGDLARAELPQALAWGGLPAGVRVTKAPSLFPRLDAEGRVAHRPARRDEATT